MTESIILLHGALGSMNQFEHLNKLLSQKFNVFSFDFEGHGQTQSNSDFSIDLFTANVLDFILQNKLDPVHIFGYSMGGYVGLNFALKYPDKLKKIITLGTKFDWTKEFAQHEVALLHPDKIEEKVPKFAQHLQKIHSSSNWKKVVQNTSKMISDLGNGKCLKPSDFGQINNKVLILVGDQDHMVNLEESKKIADLLVNGKLLILSNTPHGLEKVDLIEINNIIDNFIG